jgi:hypothetical protein
MKELVYIKCMNDYAKLCSNGIVGVAWAVYRVYMRKLEAF